MAEQGADLRELEGMHVVCSPEGVILTVYRNHDLRGLKPSRRSHRFRRRPAATVTSAPGVFPASGRVQLERVGQNAAVGSSNHQFAGQRSTWGAA